MRKVTERISTALINGKKKTISNTSTDGVSMFLHQNKIIKTSIDIMGYKVNRTFFNLRSSCTNGLTSSTTRERLNGYLHLAFPESPFSFAQKNWQQVITGYKDNKRIYKVIDDNNWLSYKELHTLFNS